jgi:MinD-like ATPase involved in chromosome partitioning or flagellar assembly
VPNDYQAVMSSINTGNPVVLASPRSKIARSVTQLSDWVGQQKPSGRGQPKHRGFSLKRLVWNTKETPGA